MLEIMCYCCGIGQIMEYIFDLFFYISLILFRSYYKIVNSLILHHQSKVWNMFFKCFFFISYAYLGCFCLIKHTVIAVIL